MPTLSSLRNRALGVLQRFGPTLDQAAVAREVLCPEENPETLPAIFDPSDFDRVTACEKTTTMEEERARMAGGRRHHGATVLYRLRDAELRGAWLSSRGWRTCVSSKPVVARGAVRTERDHAAFATTFVGSLYFAHWLADDLPLLLEAGHHGHPISAAYPPYSHHQGYLDLMGLSVEPVARARIRDLIWIDNVAQNSYRARQYRELRRRVAQATVPGPGRNIVLHRGRSGAARLLANEDALEELLAKRGFEVVNAEALTAQQIAQACAGARIALGVEGSQIAHAFFAMAERGAIVAMVPPYRYINHYKDLTDCIGTMRYASITGNAVEGGFHIDPDGLLRLLDRVERELPV